LIKPLEWHKNEKPLLSNSTRKPIARKVMATTATIPGEAGVTSVHVNGGRSYGMTPMNGGCSDGAAPTKGGLICVRSYRFKNTIECQKTNQDS
jgi:hypothetical protein